MSLLESRSNCQFFAFEHSHQYRQIQYLFLDAVETLNPENITVRRGYVAFCVVEDLPSGLERDVAPW